VSKFPLPARPSLTAHRGRIERVDGEIKRRTEVVGIFPNEAAVRRIVGVILLEQDDEGAVQRTRSTSPADGHFQLEKRRRRGHS
jgi:putative transposase